MKEIFNTVKQMIKTKQILTEDNNHFGFYSKPFQF